MKRQTSVAVLLYIHLYPNPSPSDPQNFSIYLARHLIPEIRVETARFYGGLDSIEARYPGLNYCHRPHRMRLSTFPHHARLFRAIDALGLTDHEVLDLVRWEGTIWARERFERDEGYRVKDTTGDGIGPWMDPRVTRRASEIKVDRAVEVAVEVPASAQAAVQASVAVIQEEVLPSDDEDQEMDGEDDLGEALESISEDLNQRLLAAMAARQQGQHVEIDASLEEYLKEQIENGSLSSMLWANSSTQHGRLGRPPRLHGEETSVTRPASTPTISQPAA